MSIIERQNDAGHEANAKRLTWVLALTAAFMLAEVAGGVMFHSLALLSDAAHMFTDVFGLGLSLTAIWLGRQPADQNRTFGYYRFEVLAAALNASLMLGIAGLILVSAYERLIHPPEVKSLGMMGVAVMGLVVNLIGLNILHPGQAQDNLNIRGAYLEVWSDMISSIGVIVAAVLIHFTGWRLLDPLVAVGIGVFVLPRTWDLLKQSVNILLEGVPEGLRLADIESALYEVEGVTDVHDLHVWAVTSGQVSLTCHIMIDPNLHHTQAILEAVAAMLEDRFAITHTTIQVECLPETPGTVAQVLTSAR
jgi:cobalt-zinc-cadmium efflux system protein